MLNYPLLVVLSCASSSSPLGLPVMTLTRHSQQAAVADIMSKCRANLLDIMQALWSLKFSNYFSFLRNDLNCWTNRTINFAGVLRKEIKGFESLYEMDLWAYADWKGCQKKCEQLSVGDAVLAWTRKEITFRWDLGTLLSAPSTSDWSQSNLFTQATPEQNTELDLAFRWFHNCENTDFTWST